MKASNFQNSFSMTLNALATALACLGASFPAHADRSAQFTPDPVSAMSVYQAVNLRGTDGKSVSILADEWKSISTGNDKLEILPAPSVGTDSKLCQAIDSSNVSSANINNVLAEANMLSALASLFTALPQAYPHQLTAAQAAFLKTVPHCAPYLDTLNAIATYLADQGSANDRLQLVKAQPIQVSNIQFADDSSGRGIIRLLLVSGASVEFHMADGNGVGLSPDKTPEGFESMTIPASVTGQNVGMTFKVVNFSQGDAVASTQQQRCEITRNEQVCDGPGNEENGQVYGGDHHGCRWLSVTHYGWQDVTTGNQPSNTLFQVALTDASNQILATINFAVYNPGSGAVFNEGDCVLDNRYP